MIKEKACVIPGEGGGGGGENIFCGHVLLCTEEHGNQKVEQNEANSFKPTRCGGK